MFLNKHSWGSDQTVDGPDAELLNMIPPGDLEFGKTGPVKIIQSEFSFSILAYSTAAKRWRIYTVLTPSNPWCAT